MARHPMPTFDTWLLNIKNIPGEYCEIPGEFGQMTDSTLGGVVYKEENSSLW